MQRALMYGHNQVPVRPPSRIHAIRILLQSPLILAQVLIAPPPPPSPPVMQLSATHSLILQSENVCFPLAPFSSYHKSFRVELKP